MYKARNNLLTYNIWKMFQDREGGYNLKEKPKFKTQNICKTKERFSFLRGKTQEQTEYRS